MASREHRYPEVDFPSVHVEEILDLYFRNGCVLLRNCFSARSVETLRANLASIYRETEGPHVYPSDFQVRGLPAFHEQLFRWKHHGLVDSIFAGHLYAESASTVSRRVRLADPGGHWLAPLAPHFDALFHGYDFQINFWTPLHACDEEVPRLFVVPADFAEVIEYTGYNGQPQGNIAWPGQFDHFKQAVRALYLENSPDDEYRARFGSRTWAPEYRLGDAMLASNWTLHGTHAAPHMTAERENVELRFACSAPLTAIIEAQERWGRSIPKWW